jgi:putative ATP-binding cassette transporter
LAYPSVSQSVDVALIDDVLKAVDLGHLSRIDQETMHWSQRLSGGEQQRLAFARAILQAPDWLFLDEAMSALPESAQVSMLALLRLRLPQVSLVSISHSAALGGQYTQLLEFVIDRDGQPQLVLVEGG